MEVTVLHNQSLFDISIRYTGKVENAFDIAVFNGLSVTDPLISGQIILIPPVNTDEDMISFFKRKNIQPATAIVSDLIEVRPLAGIGYWEIETEFIIDE